MTTGLRFVTLLSKSVLVFGLAFWLTPADVAAYGLVAAYSGLATYLVNADFYSYSTRLIAKGERSTWAATLRGHVQFLIVQTGLFLLVTTPIWLFTDLAAGQFGWVVVLAIIEALGLDLARILTAMGSPFFSNVVLFVRAGTWPLPLLLAVWLVPGLRSVQTVFVVWLVLDALGVGLGVVGIWRKRLVGWHTRLGWPWFRRGIKIAATFLFATLMLRALFSIDRELVLRFAGENRVAAYTVYAGVAQAMTALLEAGVFSYTYPALLRAHATADRQAYSKALVAMARGVAVVVAFFAVCAVILLPILLGYIPNPTYRSFLGDFHILLAAQAVYNLSMIPHYVLYAGDRDRWIVASHVVAFAGFLAGSFGLHALGVDAAVPWGVLAGFAAMLCVKLLGVAKSGGWNPVPAVAEVG
ncbi:MAG: hypothetical protein LBR32_09990 [Propionibacteriaceae bacterium]|jgi:O-antigen/teichoic acid export membrane protein|nr:hypothetical protein [Propionibacteriaceae bacterium]